MKAFGQAGERPCSRHRRLSKRRSCASTACALVGRVKAVRERYYAISAERRLKHPGVLAITETAKTEVFT